MPVSEVARRVGELDAATNATITSLTKRGYLVQERGDPGGALAVSHVVRVTETGLALLDQMAAVQLRLLDTLVVTLDDDGVRGFREALRSLAKALDAAASSRSSGSLRTSRSVSPVDRAANNPWP